MFRTLKYFMIFLAFCPGIVLFFSPLIIVAVDVAGCCSSNNALGLKTHPNPDPSAPSTCCCPV